ncbi:MAG: hypothetical protein GY793_04075 [Proteobacteria bacterium]|nr:hypothetical protein [Pseudomonadota bacterium]
MKKLLVLIVSVFTLSVFTLSIFSTSAFAEGLVEPSGATKAGEAAKVIGTEAYKALAGKMRLLANEANCQNFAKLDLRGKEKAVNAFIKKTVKNKGDAYTAFNKMFSYWFDDYKSEMLEEKMAWLFQKPIRIKKGGNCGDPIFADYAARCLELL